MSKNYTKMKANLKYCIIGVVYFIIGCSCKKDPIINSQNLIKNPSFEKNGQATYQNWIVSDYDLGLTSFSKDVPRGGMKWSLQIKSLNPMSAMAAMDQVKTYITGQSGTNVYQLKVWMKCINQCIGTIWLSNLSPNYKGTKLISNNQSDWHLYTITDTLTTNPNDSIAVFFSAGGQYIQCKCLFDLVEVKKIIQ